MKKFIILFTFIFSAMLIFGQSGKVQSITVDTVKGNENIYLTSEELTGSYETVSLTAVFDKISSAAGGTAYVQGSIDGTNYVTLTSTDNLFIFFPNDTVTITDGGVMTFVALKNPYTKYRYFIDGDANDTVKITPKYRYIK